MWTNFPRLDEILGNFGRVDVVPEGIPVEPLEAMISEGTSRKPDSSSREVAKASGTDHSTLLFVLNKHGFKPFKQQAWV